MSMKAGALSGKVVVELGSMIAAPFACHILSQLGARVIKLEPPTGEATRKLVRGGPSGTYIAYNRGKESLCVDLQSKEGQKIFRKLAGRADIVVHNLSPGAARRLNVTYEACAAANPGIVYCHIKGYGPGPLAEEVASNPIAEAATGVMYSNRIDGRPSRLGPSYHDQFAGSYAVIAILAALSDPDGPQERRNIELGLYETGLHVAARELVGVQLKSQLLGRPEQEPSPEFSMPGYGAYKTGDDRWIYLVMLTDEHWRKFCLAASIAIDPELSTLRQRRKRRAEVEDLVRNAVASLGYEQIAAKLSRNGVGFTEVLSTDRVLQAAQAREPEKYSEISFAAYDFQAPDFPVPACTGSLEPELPPPLLGEQTRSLMADIGFDDVEVGSYLENGIVFEADPKTLLWAK